MKKTSLPGIGGNTTRGSSASQAANDPPTEPSETKTSLPGIGGNTTRGSPASQVADDPFTDQSEPKTNTIGDGGNTTRGSSASQAAHDPPAEPSGQKPSSFRTGDITDQGDSVSHGTEDSFTQHSGDDDLQHAHAGIPLDLSNTDTEGGNKDNKDNKNVTDTVNIEDEDAINEEDTAPKPYVDEEAVNEEDTAPKPYVDVIADINSRLMKDMMDTNTNDRSRTRALTNLIKGKALAMSEISKGKKKHGNEIRTLLQEYISLVEDTPEDFHFKTASRGWENDETWDERRDLSSSGSIKDPSYLKYFHSGGLGCSVLGDAGC